MCILQTMEVDLEHPFFVYGKGWSSISPEKSLSCYDLPCLRLSEGDMCISLSPRPSAGSTANSVKRRWSAPAENGIEDCHEPPVAQRTKHWVPQIRPVTHTHTLSVLLNWKTMFMKLRKMHVITLCSEDFLSKIEGKWQFREGRNQTARDNFSFVENESWWQG